MRGVGGHGVRAGCMVAGRDSAIAPGRGMRVRVTGVVRNSAIRGVRRPAGRRTVRGRPAGRRSMRGVRGHGVRAGGVVHAGDIDAIYLQTITCVSASRRSVRSR